VTDEETKQTGLIITPDDQSAIMVDDLEVAQFIYLLLNREKIRNVINTVTRRGVLLLGRFGDGGLPLLQAVAVWLRMPENGSYLPLLFDFPRPESKTYTDTIRTLASLARLGGPPIDVSRGPFNFWKTTPYKVVRVRFMCPKTRRKLASSSNCKIPSWVELPPSSRPQAKPQPRPKAPAISARFMR